MEVRIRESNSWIRFIFLPLNKIQELLDFKEPSFLINKVLKYDVPSLDSV